MKLPAEVFGRLGAAYAGRSVCVTGGAGFIGGHLVDALASLAPAVKHITVIDDLSNSNLDHLGELIELDPQRISFVHGSILDDDAVQEAVDGAAVVFHLAAMGSVQASLVHPQRAFSVNATGTVRVAEAARRLGCGRVVFSSSSSVYGGTSGPTPHACTENLPLAPLSPYAASKAAGELVLASWCKSFGLSGVSLRYFNVFGPRQRPDAEYAAVIPLFVRACIDGQIPTVYGDGLQSRDFTPVANAVLANLMAGVSTNELSGQALNIGTGQRTDVLTLLELISKALGQAPITPKFVPGRSGEVRHSLADITAARNLLGYEPIANLESAIGEAVDYYRETLNTPNS